MHGGGVELQYPFDFLTAHVAVIPIHLGNVSAVAGIGIAHIPREFFAGAWIVLGQLAWKRSAGDIVQEYAGLIAELRLSGILFGGRDIVRMRIESQRFTDRDADHALLDQLGEIGIQQLRRLLEIVGADHGAGRWRERFCLRDIEIEVTGECGGRQQGECQQRVKNGSRLFEHDNGPSNWLQVKRNARGQLRGGLLRALQKMPNGRS